MTNMSADYNNMMSCLQSLMLMYWTQVATGSEIICILGEHMDRLSRDTLSQTNLIEENWYSDYFITRTKGSGVR